MTEKSWHLNRRTFLRGTGVGLALPWLECMSGTAHAAATKDPPKRLCAIYVPFGVALPPTDSPHAKWNWFPSGEGSNYRFSEPLKSLEPYRDKLTVLGGLSHPNGRKMGGHDTGDIFLTAAHLSKGELKNTVSIDQVFAAKHGHNSRFHSLVLSSGGGVGEPTRSTTISYSHEGSPIPALSKPAQIYARLFGVTTGADAVAEKQQLSNSINMLDRILAHSRDIRRQLGTYDQRKLDEYLESVRSVERGVQRAQSWLDTPKAKVDPETLKLTSSPEDPIAYLETMFDLMALAFQTDSTRAATYMVGQVKGGGSIANAFPAAIGLTGNWHGLAHRVFKDADGPKNCGRFDQFMVQQLTRFIGKLDNMPEADGTVLDHTAVLYGSTNSNTHQNTNYPIILAGGNRLGFKHGQYQRHDANTPFSNLFVTMLNRLDVPTDRFMDSTGALDV